MLGLELAIQSGLDLGLGYGSNSDFFMCAPAYK